MLLLGVLSEVSWDVLDVLILLLGETVVELMVTVVSVSRRHGVERKRACAHNLQSSLDLYSANFLGKGCRRSMGR